MTGCNKILTAIFQHLVVEAVIAAKGGPTSY
uniref:Uncharacterized protein n=1 Tax=Pygocentrus nattereri TaxID=42514 RepID=A0AAR2JG46_PYGNA